LRTLRVPSTSGIVNNVSWEGYGLRLALAVDTAILFANIQPEYMWSYFNKTLVFAFRKPERNDMCVIFWDTSIDEKHIKYVKGLMHVKAAGDYCVLASKVDDQVNQWVLILCNAVGCPIDSKFINFEPTFVDINKTHVVVCSEDVIYYWQYRSAHSKLASLESEKKKKVGKENIFHIDEIPNPNNVYDREKWKLPDMKNTDPITCLSASDECFIVGRDSGVVHKYALPYIQVESKHSLRCKPQQVKINCDGSKFSIIDINGVLSFYDMEAIAPGSRSTGYHLSQERKEVWSVVWSSDNPHMCALMEKNRLYVLNNFEADEPILSPGYLCEFSDLEVKAILLDDILKNPEDLKNLKEQIVSYEAKQLRDTKDLLTTVSLREAVEYIESNPHPKLWKLLSETALDKLDFELAEKAFVKLEQYHGIEFCQKLANIGDKHKQKAEIAAFFKRYDEAEQIYNEMDRKDLLLEMRMRLGDWSKVVQLIEQGVGNDEVLKKAYNHLGDYCRDKQKWKKSAYYY
jgi:WD repeat-containing protein 35